MVLLAIGQQIVLPIGVSDLGTADILRDPVAGFARKRLQPSQRFVVLPRPACDGDVPGEIDRRENPDA
jgi:hypothetical protein